MNLIKSNHGWLEVICGPMFSGKSEELLRKLNRLDYAKIDYIVFTPSIDTRVNKNIASRNGFKKNAITISDPYEIYNNILESKKDLKVIAIDEVQFLDAKKLIDVVDTLIKKGYVVYTAGLDNDFRNYPFQTTSLLLSKANKVYKLTSICTICGAEGSCTQRIVNGIPANANEDLFEIGDFESYTARCVEHHELPGSKISSQSKEFLKNISKKLNKQ